MVPWCRGMLRAPWEAPLDKIPPAKCGQTVTATSVMIGVMMYDNEDSPLLHDKDDDGGCSDGDRQHNFANVQLYFVSKTNEHCNKPEASQSRAAFHELECKKNKRKIQEAMNKKTKGG